MKGKHREAFDAEVAAARAARAAGRMREAFAHLERAHILGQRYVGPHTLVHRLMLGIAWQERDASAMWGQLVRVVLGALGSAVGRVPVGNTGGTDISMFRRLPIDPELARIMEDGSNPAPRA